MKGTGHLKKVFRTLKRQFKPGAVILLYHRVASLPNDPFSLAVSPDHFAQQLEYIRQTCQPMRLIDLVKAIQQRSLPQRAVAITFDDGYADNFTHAYPLLTAAQIPATIFVSSDQIDKPHEFWWDELERILLLPEQLPNQLRFSINGHGYEWNLETEAKRQHAHQVIHSLLRPLTAVIRNQVLKELVCWAGLERAGRAGYRAMTTTELVQLAQSEWIDLGGHTVTHPVLSTLSTKAQYTEIVGGRQRLEGIIGNPVLTFSYPYGGPHNFSDETAEIVESVGFLAACTTSPGSIEPGVDLFRLCRCPVFDWGIETFKQQLEAYFIA